MIGLSAVFFFTSIYAGRAMRQQALEANETLLKVYLEKIDSNVQGISRFLSQFPSSNENISVMVRTQDKTAHYLAKQAVASELRRTAFIYNTFNGIFVYSAGKLENTFICQLRSGTGLQQQEDIRSLVTDKERVLSDGWQVTQCGGRIYLLCTVRAGDTLCGVWLDPESAIEPLTQLREQNGGMIGLLDAEGAVLGGLQTEQHFSPEENGKTIRLDGIRYLQITKEAAYLPVNLIALIPERVFTEKVRVTQLVLLAVFAAALLLLPFVWLLMNRAVTRPVEKLTQAMARIGAGDLEASVEEKSRFYEFETIAGSLNQMTRRIRQLQKDVYERQLSEQKTKLQYLQMQIRPHFFLNALNVIYSFSLTGRNDLIEQLTLCLSQYFRYLFRCESAYVPLGAEIEHIRNYMQIHRLRDQGNFAYHEEIDEVLTDALIPPLIIQPFVENCVKYGAGRQGQTEIYLTVEARTSEGEQKLCIMVRDEGPGYPQKILERFENGQPLNDDVTKKIGIVNVRQRLLLTYGGAAELHIGNSPDGGAWSELLLSLQWQEESEEETYDDSACG